MSQVNHSMPHSIEAERALLASMLHCAAIIDEYISLPGSIFYDPRCKMLFLGICEMKVANEPVDLLTITQHFTDKGMDVLAKIGGAEWITDLWSGIVTHANAAYYASIVMEKAMRRNIIEQCQLLAATAMTDFDLSADELLEQTEKTLMRLRIENVSENRMNHIKEGLQEAVTQLEHSYKNRGATVGLASGLNDFDRMTGGLKEGQLVVIAARPGMGKTCMLMQFAREFARNVPVGIFSLEMNEAELAGRFLCNEASIDLARVRDGFLNRADFSNLSLHFNRLVKDPIYIDDTGGLSILEFRSRARKAVIRYGIKAIFVDYLQLMRSTSKRAQENRNIEVAEISMTLKNVAKELRIPVIVAAQLNRDAEQRNSPPRLSDLRESGQIEQDADIVGLLHRPKKESDSNADRERCSMIIAKQRNGPVGEISLRFRGEYARFENVTPEMYSNDKEKRQK